MNDSVRPPLEVVQDLVTEDRGLSLEARDLGLMLLIRHELERRQGQVPTITLPEIRTLAARVDSLDARDGQGAEKRLTECMTRMLRAECITRADMDKLTNPDEAEYQLTGLGEAIAGWQSDRAKFDGEPLAAILKAFNIQLEAIKQSSEKPMTSEEWRVNVDAQLHSVAGELLMAIQRHQRGLDREHALLREFVPALLKESSEDSIEICERQLNDVADTIRDLLEVTIGASSVAFRLLVQISERASECQSQGTELVCQSLQRRLETIVEWTNLRHRDWGTHFDTVHGLLRFIIRVDKERKITEALKQAVSAEPIWTLQISDAPRLLRFRENDELQQTPKKAMVRKRVDYMQRTEVITIDPIPVLMRSMVDAQLIQGSAKWSYIVKTLTTQGHALPKIIKQLPMLMSYMTTGTTTVRGNREVCTITDRFTLEEFEVRK